MTNDWRLILYRLVNEHRRDVWADSDMLLASMLGEIMEANDIDDDDRETAIKLSNAYSDVILGAASPKNILRTFSDQGIKEAEVWSERILKYIVDSLGDSVLDQSDYLLDRLSEKID